MYYVPSTNPLCWWKLFVVFVEYRYSATHVVRELEVTERGAGFNEISVAVGGSLLPPIDESRGTAGSATTTEALHTTHSDYVHRRTFRAIPAKKGKFSSSLSLSKGSLYQIIRFLCPTTRFKKKPGRSRSPALYICVPAGEEREAEKSFSPRPLRISPSAAESLSRKSKSDWIDNTNHLWMELRGPPGC